MLTVRLLFLVNDFGYFVSHRLKIASAACADGHAVSVAYGERSGAYPPPLDTPSLKTYGISMSRGGGNLFREFRSLHSIWTLLRKLRPDIVHLITIKPYLYGGIVARLLRIPGVVSAVAGMGSLFIRSDWRSRCFRALLFPLYWFAFGHPNQRVIVQNQDDANILINWGVLDPRKVRLLRGSGVDLGEYTLLAEPEGIPTICFAARLLRDKGINEFVSAARLLRERGVHARFWVAGDTDRKNPTGLTEAELCALREEGIVELLGYRRDIPTLYAQSHVVCLPSYREGLPKALIEAAAASRAIVSTDVPGCRDAIIPNVSGLLVPVRNPEKLADALQWLIDHPEERLAMGKAGRQLAEREFAIEKIVQEHLNIYRELRHNVG